MRTIGVALAELAFAAKKFKKGRALMNMSLREAEQWFACIRSHDCTPDQRAEFLEWLYEDFRNGEAFAVVERQHGRLRPDFSWQRAVKYEYG